MPLTYLTFNGDLFNLPAGPVSFALGGEYVRGEMESQARLTQYNVPNNRFNRS